MKSDASLSSFSLKVQVFPFSNLIFLQTFCLFSYCLQRCWCHWSCHCFSVCTPPSLCCSSVASKHTQEISHQNNNQQTETCTSETVKQPFTDCFSSISCLCSWLATERTMVFWGSEVEETSPRLGDGRDEECGVRGITVSCSILRSCCDGTFRWLINNTEDNQFANMFFLLLFHWLYLIGASTTNTVSYQILVQLFTHLLMVLPLLLHHLSLRLLPLLLQLLLLTLVLLLLPWQQTCEKQHRASKKTVCRWIFEEVHRHN